MVLEVVDYILLFGFFALSLVVGILVKRSQKNDTEGFFLSGRNMPWWLLGVSMVATTFAADTPNLVAGIVRKNGVAGNWEWWAYLLTGMLTVFFYARLWRRSGVTTDLEFYELRYSGKAAAFLRGFRAIYLGVVFNIIIMATVSLAAIKIGHVMFGFSAAETLIIASVTTVIYSLLGGLKGVLITDFVQFFIAMIGSIWATVYLLDMPQIGGLEQLVKHPNVQDKIALVPDFSNTDLLLAVFVIPLAVQWWSTWYPGAEPGGGGYIAQRMLAAKNEKHATWAVLFFNLAHYALRPWPWILIGLASLVIFPDLDSLRAAFPDLSDEFIKDDLSYPAMLSFLPAGLAGLVITGLIAAFMSTISTHLNWGSSYVVNDFYARFLKPEASEKEKLVIGRVSIVVMMALAGLLSLVLQEAKVAFDLIVQIGAGTGLLFILRWFWYRINPWSEISAMVSSFIIAVVFLLFDTLPEWGVELVSWEKILINVSITTAVWMLVTLFTPRTNAETLKHFHALVFGEGGKFYRFPKKIISFLLGVAGVYALLFGFGKLLYGELVMGWALCGLFLFCFGGLFLLRRRVF